MNENATANGGGVATAPAPLAENEHIKELFAILQEQGKDTAGLTALLHHVEGMETFVQQAERQIAGMKSQLDEMKEIQSHPIRTALQNTVKALETRVSEIQKQLAELKTSIIEGCKNAVAAFKDKGPIVLDTLATFFRVKSCMEKIQNSATAAANRCDKTLADIESFSKEYHNTTARPPLPNNSTSFPRSQRPSAAKRRILRKSHPLWSVYKRKKKSSSSKSSKHLFQSAPRKRKRWNFESEKDVIPDMFTKADLTTMQRYPLSVKIGRTQARIMEYYNTLGGNVYVSCSGGKDSIVLLDIVRRMYPDVLAVYCDTQLEFPEIRLRKNDPKRGVAASGHDLCGSGQNTRLPHCQQGVVEGHLLRTPRLFLGIAED